MFSKKKSDFAVQTFICKEIIVLLFLALFPISCKKSNNNINNNNGHTIYIAGSNGKNPVLWKNGIAQILSPTGGMANQVQVYNNRVYVGGISGQDTSGIINFGGPGGENVYWVNGAQTIISSSLNPWFTYFTLLGNNLYYTNGYDLYKQGVVLSLPGKVGGYITGVFAAGDDLYVAGSDSVGDAVYWKNGLMRLFKRAIIQPRIRVQIQMFFVFSYQGLMCIWAGLIQVA